MKINIIPIQKNHVEEVINLLQLVSKFKPQRNNYDEIYEKFTKNKNHYGLVAISNSQKVLGYGSIILEYKIRGGLMGHIDDIVVNKKFQNMGIGKMIIKSLVEIANENKCFKITLFCQKNNIAFYKKMKFKNSGFNMTRILFDNII